MSEKYLPLLATIVVFLALFVTGGHREHVDDRQWHQPGDAGPDCKPIHQFRGYLFAVLGRL